MSSCLYFLNFECYINFLNYFFEIIGSDQDIKDEPPSKRVRYDTGNGELSQDQSIKV